ncbi:unnamed protein product [Heligmosomoides polygyrus]|uniref:MSP domain-containing protein n=1 Tax=Heligmosomoides polygyrus TaxID=6339 RepID=A0A183GS47_HELPZ|nr:unnamed protein product [Heligmosomoides polygyrus]
MYQCIKPTLLRPRFMPFAGQIYVKANLPNSVTTSAKNVAIPPKASFTSFSIFVPITLRQVSISFVGGQHSAPYIATGRTAVADQGT